jgi:hypothetical protein
MLWKALREPSDATLRFFSEALQAWPADQRKETIMAQTETRWEKSDQKLHVEEEISPVKAKQGRTGRRILAVLIAALVLAFLVWIPVEIWGQKEADDVAPQQPGQQMQSQVPEAAPQSGATAPAQPAAPAPAPAQ